MAALMDDEARLPVGGADRGACPSGDLGVHPRGEPWFGVSKVNGKAPSGDPRPCLGRCPTARRRAESRDLGVRGRLASSAQCSSLAITSSAHFERACFHFLRAREPFAAEPIPVFHAPLNPTIHFSLPDRNRMPAPIVNGKSI